MQVDRSKLREILLKQKTLDLLAIWLSVLEESKGLLVDKILEASDFELALALNRNLGWRFKVV